MSVGRKVRKWRLAKGLSERQAATKAGISQPAWRAVEADQMKRIGLEVARKIVGACEGAISIEDFFAAERRRRSIPPAA